MIDVISCSLFDVGLACVIAGVLGGLVLVVRAVITPSE